MLFKLRSRTVLIALVIVSLGCGAIRADVTIEENVTYGSGGDTLHRTD